MFQACIKKLLLVFIFSISSVLIAEDYQAGKHYQVLSEPIATRDSKKNRGHRVLLVWVWPLLQPRKSTQ